MRRLVGAVGRLGLLLVAGCSSAMSPLGAPTAPEPTDASRPPSDAAALASGAPSGEGSRPVQAAPPDQARQPEQAITPASLVNYQLTQLLKKPVFSFALGNAFASTEVPRIAVQSDEPWLFDQKGWREIPVSPALKKQGGEAEISAIYFGRDNQPRLMGYRQSSQAADQKVTPVYLRHKLTGWQKEPSELGQLGRPVGALYGILGEADPEVVCRPGELCLIKRVSGWATAPADAEPAFIQMAGSQVFKVAAGSVFQLEASTWVQVREAAPPGAVTGIWGEPGGGLVVAASGALYRSASASAAWAVVATPHERVSQVLLVGQQLWVTGAAGLCLFQSARWACAEGLGPMAALQARGDDLYVGGPSGLYQLKASR